MTRDFDYKEGFIQPCLDCEQSEKEISQLKTVAESLYAALVQMKRRRGIDMADADLVISALELWEEANGEVPHD